MKPIELGCRAIIVRSVYPSNLGKEVTVVTHDPEDEDGLIWEVERKAGIEGCVPGPPAKIGTHSWCCTEQLMRIDDYKSEGMEMAIEDTLSIIKLKEAAR